MISLILPTRKRPENIDRFINSVLSTASNQKEIEFCFYIDKDDSESKLQLENWQKLNANVKFIQGERICLSEMWNKAYEQLATGNILGHMGDDLIFQTKGWDDILKAKFAEYPDEIVCCFGDDGSPNGKTFGTHCFISRKWVELSGFFVPPYFVSDYNDTWLNDVGDAIKRKFNLPFLTEHMHFVWGKGPKDLTHIERIQRHNIQKPELIYKEKLVERQRNIRILDDYIKYGKASMLLSILIPSTLPRIPFLNRLLHHLKIDNLPPSVEIIVCMDDGENKVGAKRNKLLQDAIGEYVVFLDDDDMVANNYIERMLEVIKRDKPDYIGYKILLTIDGHWTKPTYHSLKHPYKNTDDGYYTNVCHINPIKRTIAQKFLFPNISLGEDRDWSKMVYDSGLVKTETFIDEYMYYYFMRQVKTNPLRVVMQEIDESKVKIINLTKDTICLSKSKQDQLLNG